MVLLSVLSSSNLTTSLGLFLASTNKLFHNNFNVAILCKTWPFSIIWTWSHWQYTQFQVLTIERRTVEVDEQNENFKMGNTHCVADGGCPQRADITIANNTEFNLYLDPSKACGRECHHRGWQVTDGKIVQGFEPPHLVKSYDYATFSVSGRDTSSVAPKGKVFYVNPDKDLSIICDWYACGWTNLSNTASQASITICGNKTTRVGYGVQKTPWNRILVGEATAEPWKFSIRQR